MESRVQSEVFLRRDIESILRAIDYANAQLADRHNARDVEVYRAGFVDALNAVATALHVRLHTPLLEELVDSEVWRSSVPSENVPFIEAGVNRD